MTIDSMDALTFQTPHDNRQLNSMKIYSTFPFLTLMTICKIILQITIDSIPFFLRCSLRSMLNSATTWYSMNRDENVT